MFLFKKKIPTKWEILAKQIIANQDLVVHKVDGDRDAWFVFNYDNNEYKISSHWLGLNFGSSYEFIVTTDGPDNSVSIADLFKHETLRRIFNNALHCYYKIDRNKRVEIAEKQIFGNTNDQTKE